MKQVKEFERIDVAECMARERATEVKSIAQVHLDLLEAMDNPRQDQGVKLPFCRKWPDDKHPPRIRDKELIVMAGYNGHFKSSISAQIAMEFIYSGLPVGVMSMEMPITDTAELFVKLAWPDNQLNDGLVQDFVEYAADKLFIYDQMDPIQPVDATSCIWHMARKLGCKLVILDSMMQCNVTEDTETERRFVQMLAAMAKTLNITILLIHHMRKPGSEGESKRPGKYDLIGSSHISNNAMQVWIVWHDKVKFMRKNSGIAVDNDAPDMEFYIAKQRNGRFEGVIDLWQHPDQRAFSSYRTGQLDNMAVSINALQGGKKSD